jgi:hypothetical protein
MRMLQRQPQIFRCAQDDSMEWLDERRCGSDEKQLRILRLAALAQDDNQVLLGAGKVSCFPRSQKRDLIA